MRTRALALTLFLAATAFATVPAAHAAPPPQLPDFNGDGYADAAIGAPGENSAEGAVTVLYGTSSGPSNATVEFIQQGHDGVLDSDEKHDSFGGALAFGDFDDDGFTDLAVGVPNEDTGGHEDGGAVSVLYGSGAGLIPTRNNDFFTQNVSGIGAGVDEEDLFGWALAAGDFDADGVDDLAISAPNEDMTWLGGGEDAGEVYILAGAAGTGLHTTNKTFSESLIGMCCENDAEEDDQFGWSLTAGNFGKGRPDDLAIGVPGEGDEKSGAVVVVYGVAGVGLDTPGNQEFTQESPGMCCSLSEDDDRMGWSVAAGNFGNSKQDDLAIGVPFESVGKASQGLDNAGAVQVLYGSPQGLSTNGDQQWTQNTTGMCCTTAEPIDAFGYSLAAENWDSVVQEDLAIGAPGEGVDKQINSGAVNVLYGTPAGLQATGAGGPNDQVFTQNNPGMKGSSAEDDDRFAISLGVGGSGPGLPGRPLGFLLIGVPYENTNIGSQVFSDAGAIHILFATGQGLSVNDNQFWDQSAVGVGDEENYDFFGYALSKPFGV
jgi:FG-GAP repeat protein